MDSARAYAGGSSEGPEDGRAEQGWDDGLIARRARGGEVSGPAGDHAGPAGHVSPVRRAVPRASRPGDGEVQRCPEGPHVHGADAHGSFPCIGRAQGTAALPGPLPAPAPQESRGQDPEPDLEPGTGPDTAWDPDGTGGEGAARGDAGDEDLQLDLQLDFRQAPEQDPEQAPRQTPEQAPERASQGEDPAQDDGTGDPAQAAGPALHEGRARSPYEASVAAAGGALRRRLGAMRELIGLSRTRLEGKVLAEAGRVLDEAGARSRLSAAYTTIAIAGATGSGKSSLFNALAGRQLSEVGLRRPTTAEPVACTWEAEREGGADGLLDRLGIAPGVRRRVRDAELHGLVLVDLPDHDSLTTGHRDQVDRLLGLVDAVLWVVDPEKYADALLHERYLRPLAGYAEVTFVVLNQADRLPGDARDAVLHDMRRLLDEDGMALGEHGEPGARVLAVSALTGSGMQELREELGEFVAGRQAAARRLTADLDGAAERLRPVYADPALSAPAGLTEADRERFEDLLASAVGAAAAGQAAERAWLRQAERSCGTAWSQFVRWYDARRQRGTSRTPAEAEAAAKATAADRSVAADGGPPEEPGAMPDHGGVRVARPVLTQAVREMADRAVTGLPEAWRKTVRDAAWRGAEGLPEALDAVVGEAAVDGTAGGPAGGPAAGEPRQTAGPPHPVRPPRPPWWTAAVLVQGLLLMLQLTGVVLLAGAVLGLHDSPVWVPVSVLVGGAVAAPLLAAACRAAARGPARAYGQEEELRLRQLAAGCGRTRVLEPVAAELLRYREVREQYVVAAGAAGRP